MPKVPLLNCDEAQLLVCGYKAHSLPRYLVAPVGQRPQGMGPVLDTETKTRTGQSMKAQSLGKTTVRASYEEETKGIREEWSPDKRFQQRRRKYTEYR